MKWAVKLAAGHRWGHISPELLNYTFTNALQSFVFTFWFLMKLKQDKCWLFWLTIFKINILSLTIVISIKRHYLHPNSVHVTCFTLSWTSMCVWSTMILASRWSLSIKVSLELPKTFLLCGSYGVYIVKSMNYSVDIIHWLYRTLLESTPIIFICIV